MAINPNNPKRAPIPVVPRTMQIVNADGTPTRAGILLLEQLQEAGAVGPPGPAGESGADDGAVWINDLPVPGAHQVVQNTRGDHLSVRMFGAQGDGIANDTTALQAAIDYGIANSVAIYIPSGVYLHTGLNINGPLMLYGQGKSATTLKNISFTNNPSLRVMGTDESTRIAQVLLADFSLLGDPANTGNGLELAFIDSSEFRNLSIREHGGDGVNGGFCFVLQFNACEVILNRGDGYRFDKALHDPTGSDDQNNIVLLGGRIVGNFGSGFHLVGGVSNIIDGTDIEANHLEGVKLERPYGFTIINCYMENNGRESNLPTIRTVDIGTNAGFGLVVRNSRVYGSGNRSGIPNPYNPTPNDTWCMVIDYMYNAEIDGNSFGNGWLGYLLLGGSAFRTKVGGNYLSAESRNMSDAGTTTGTRIDGHKFNGIAVTQAAMMHMMLDTVHFRAATQQTYFESTDPGQNTTVFINAARGRQAGIIFQNCAVATVTLSGGTVASIAVVDGGRGYPGSFALVEIEGDGFNATAHGVVTAGVVTSIVVDNAGQDYTWATVTIAGAALFLLGRQLEGASPTGADVMFVLYDLKNNFNSFEVLLNGDVSFCASGGRALIGTHFDDGLSILGVNGPIRGYTLSAGAPVRANVNQQLVTGGIRLDSNVDVVASTLTSGQLMKWDGSKVVDGGASGGSTGAALVGAISAGLSLTTSFADISGMTVTLTQTGVWLVTICGTMSVVSTDTAPQIQLVFAGSAQTGVILYGSASNGSYGASGQWLVTSTTGAEVCKAQAKKTSGSGSSSISAFSTISAVWIKP